MSWEEIFNPGLRHWKEFQDWQADKIVEAPSPDGGRPPVTVDLESGIVTVETPDDESPVDVDDADEEEPQA